MGLIWGCIGIMEKNMEPTFLGFKRLEFRDGFKMRGFCCKFWGLGRRVEQTLIQTWRYTYSTGHPCGCGAAL